MAEIIEELQQMLGDAAHGRYVLRLYVTGTTRQSSRAIANITSVCERCLKGRYELEVIDLYQRRELAHQHQIVVAPTLDKELPLPFRRLIGDLSNTRHVLLALGLKPDDTPDSPAAEAQGGKDPVEAGAHRGSGPHRDGPTATKDETG